MIKKILNGLVLAVLLVPITGLAEEVEKFCMFGRVITERQLHLGCAGFLVSTFAAAKFNETTSSLRSFVRPNLQFAINNTGPTLSRSVPGVSRVASAISGSKEGFEHNRAAVSITAAGMAILGVGSYFAWAKLTK